MQITLPDNSQIQDQAIAAGFVSVEQYVIALLRRDADRVAILQGINDSKAGRLRSAEEVETNIRGEFGISPIA